MDVLVLLAVVLALYFLPTIVAGLRKHHNHGAIFLLNLFLGWTFIGWLAALIWAATSVQQPQGPVVISVSERVSPPASNRSCPFCAEPIKTAAVVCRHCGRDLPAPPTPLPSPNPPSGAEGPLAKQPRGELIFYGVGLAVAIVITLVFALLRLEGRSSQGSSSSRLEQPSGSTGWYAQLGTFGTEENAKSALQRLSTSHLPAHLQSVQVGEKNWYRVRVGPFEDEARAASAMQSLAQEGFQGVRVVHE